MRLWSLGFLAIALLATIVSFSNENEGINIAQVLLGVALVVFSISHFSGRHDQDRDRHHHH